MLPWTFFIGGREVRLSNTSVIDAVVDPADAYAGYRLGADGLIYKKDDDGGSYTATGQWLYPADGVAADDYECLATLTAGSLTSGTTGSWLALTADRTWDKELDAPGGPDTATFTLEIRRVSTSTSLTSATINLTVEVAV